MFTVPYIQEKKYFLRPQTIKKKKKGLHVKLREGVSYTVMFDIPRNQQKVKRLPNR